MKTEKDYTGTVARMAGNIAGGFIVNADFEITEDVAAHIAKNSVLIAQAICRELRILT